VGTACPSVGTFTNSNCIPPGGSANACTSNTLKVTGKVFLDAAYSGDPSQAPMTGGKIWASGSVNTSINITNGAYNLDLGSATSATVKINYEPPIGYSLSPHNTGQESGGQVYVVTVTKDSPVANINIGAVTPPSVVKVANGSNSITGAVKYLTPGGQRLPLPLVAIELKTASGVLPAISKVVTDKNGNFKMEGIPTSGSAYELSWNQGTSWFGSEQIYVNDQLIGDAKKGTLGSTNFVFSPNPQTFPGMTYIPVDTAKTNTVKVEYVLTKTNTGGTTIPSSVTWDLYQCPKGVGYPNSGSYCKPSPNYQFTWLSNCPKSPAPGSYSGTFGRDNPAGDVQCDASEKDKIICNTIVQPMECDGSKYVNEAQCASGEMCVDRIGCTASRYTCISGYCQMNANGTFTEPTCSNTCSGGTGGGGGGNGGTGGDDGDTCNPIQTLACRVQGKTCSNGQCVTPGDGDGGGGGTCNPPKTQCDSTCTNMNSDSNNCGQCDVKCAPDQTCTQGSCQGVNTGNTKLALTIGLDGLGSTGDNLNPSPKTVTGEQTSNTNPTRKSRNITVEVYGSGSSTPVDNQPGTAVYDPDSGKFKGEVNLRSGFTTGTYIVKVSSPGYLRTDSVLMQIGSGTTNVSLNLTTGDVNGDGALTILDWNLFLSCSIYSKDNKAACNQKQPEFEDNADTTDNNIVDGDDYALFIREMAVIRGD